MQTMTLSRVLTLALACGATAAQAQSSVTIYGLASVEFLNITGFNAGTLAAPVVGSTRRLENSKVTNSRLGFRGVEDLGSGYKAVFGLESAIALDTGAQANPNKFFNRGSFVGLGHNDYGTVALGRQWNVQDELMGRYFIGGGYAVFQFSEFGYISDLVDNAVKYVSPNWSGLKVQALYAPGEGTSGPVRELGGTYAIGNFDVGITYRSATNLAGKEDKQSGFGASYQMGPLRLHAGYAVSDAQALGRPKAKAYDVGVVWAVTPLTTATLDYVKRDQLNSGNDSYFVRLQGTYQLSRRTALFANYVTLHNSGTAAEKFYGAGAPGVNQNVTSLGIRHAF